MPSHPVVPCFASFNYATGEVVEFMPGDRSPPSDEAHNSNGDESPSLGSRQFPGQSAASSRHRSSRSRSGQRRSRRRRHRMLPVYRYFKPRTLQFTAASVPSSLKSTAHERNGPSMINLAPGTVMASDAHRTLASSSLRSCDPSNDSSGPDPDHKDSQPVELAAGRPLASRPSAAAATPMAVKAASMARLYSSPQSMPRKPPSTTLELLQPRPGLSSTKSSLSRDPFSQSRALRKIDLRSPLYYSAASVPALATPGVFRDEASTKGNIEDRRTSLALRSLSGSHVAHLSKGGSSSQIKASCTTPGLDGQEHGVPQGRRRLRRHQMGRDSSGYRSGFVAETSRVCESTGDLLDWPSAALKTGRDWPDDSRSSYFKGQGIGTSAQHEEPNSFRPILVSEHFEENFRPASQLPQHQLSLFNHISTKNFSNRPISDMKSSRTSSTGGANLELQDFRQIGYQKSQKESLRSGDKFFSSSQSRKLQSSYQELIHNSLVETLQPDKSGLVKVQVDRIARRSSLDDSSQILQTYSGERDLTKNPILVNRIDAYDGEEYSEEEEEESEDEEYMGSRQDRGVHEFKKNEEVAFNQIKRDQELKYFKEAGYRCHEEGEEEVEAEECNEKEWEAEEDRDDDEGDAEGMESENDELEEADDNMNKRPHSKAYFVLKRLSKMAGNSLMSEIGVIKKPPKQIGLTYSLNLIKTQSTKSGTSPVRRPPTMEAFAGAYKIQQDSSASSPVRRSDYSARDQMKSDFSNRLEESSAAMENLQFRTSLSSSKLSALRYPLVSQRIGLQLSNRRHFLPTTIGEGGRDWILGRQVLNEVSKMGQRQVERRTEGEDIGKEYEGEAGEEEEEGELEEEDEQGREQENDQGEEEEDEEEEEEEEEEKEEDEEEEEEEEDEEEEEQEEEEEEEEDEEEKDEEEEEEEEEEEKEEEEEEEEEEEDENEEEEEEEGEGEVTAEDEEEELDAKKDEDEDEDASEERLTSDQLKSKKQASLQVNVYSAQPEQHYLYPHIYQPASRPSGKQGSHRNSEQIDSYSLSCPFRVQANRSSRRLGNQDIHGQSTDTSQTTSLFSGPSSLSSTTGQGGWNDGRQRVTRVRSSRIGERSQAKESKGVSSYGMSDKKREEIVKNDRLEYFIDAKRGERRRITRGPSNKRSHIRRTNNVNSRNLSSEHHIYQNLNLFSSVESSLPYSRTQGICEQATRSPPPLPARTGKVIEMDTKIRNTKKALSSYLYKVPIFGAETQSYSTTKPNQQALQLASDPVAPAGRVAKQNLARSRVELEHTNSDTGGLLQSRLLGAHSVNRRSRRPAAATAFMAGLSNTSTDRGRQNTRRQSMSRAETSASYRSRYSADFNSSIASEGNTPTITNNQQKRNNRIGMKGQLHAESRPSANLPSTSSDSAPFVPFHLLPLNLRPGAELKDNRVGYEEGRRKPGPTGQGLGMVKKQKGKERGSGVQGSSLASERTSELLGKNSPTKDEIDTVVTV